MNHTPQIKKAIQFAARKHRKQYRAESEPLPYITHLFSVALLVAQDGASEDAIIGALLHDTLEDTDTTPHELREQFGERVAVLVATVSDPLAPDGSELPWKERKEKYLAQVDAGEDEALVIALADKVDNIESKLEAIETYGPEVLARFTQEPAEYVWYHGGILERAQKRLPHHPLTERLALALTNEKRALAST